MPAGHTAVHVAAARLCNRTPCTLDSLLFTHPGCLLLQCNHVQPCCSHLVVQQVGALLSVVNQPHARPLRGQHNGHPRLDVVVAPQPGGWAG